MPFPCFLKSSFGCTRVAVVVFVVVTLERRLCRGLRLCVAVCTDYPLLYRGCHRVSSVSSHSLLPAVETVRLRLALSRVRRADYVCRCYCSACTRCCCVCCCCCCTATTAAVLCAASLAALSASTHGSARRSARSVPTGTTPSSTRPLPRSSDTGSASSPSPSPPWLCLLFFYLCFWEHHPCRIC
jgi:hypothetical protein